MINVSEVKLEETIQVSFFLYIFTLLLEIYWLQRTQYSVAVYVDCLCITDVLCCSAEAVGFFSPNFHDDKNGNETFASYSDTQSALP